jgi:hypothetical protein
VGGAESDRGLGGFALGVERRLFRRALQFDDLGRSAVSYVYEAKGEPARGGEELGGTGRNLALGERGPDPAFEFGQRRREERGRYFLGSDLQQQLLHRDDIRSISRIVKPLIQG